MMESMKIESGTIAIPEAMAAKCEGPNQFENFDRLFRSVIAVPKAAIDKEEAKWKRKRRKERAKKPVQNYSSRSHQPSTTFPLKLPISLPLANIFILYPLVPTVPSSTTSSAC